MIQKLVRAICLLVPMVLAGCGGGGGGASAPPAPPPQAPAPPAPTPAPAPPVSTVPTFPETTYVLTPATMSLSYAHGSVAQLEISGKPLVPRGTTYLKVSLDLQSSIVTSREDGSFSATVTAPDTLPPGLSEVSVMVIACGDPACARAIANPAFAKFRLFRIPEGVEPDTAYERPLKPLPGGAAWSTLQGNAGHTGFVPVTLSPAGFAPRYRLTQATPKAINAPLSDLAASDGLVYYSVGGRCCGAHEYATYARNEADGVIAWRAEFGPTPGYAAAAYAPAALNGKVYVIGGELNSLSLYTIDIKHPQYPQQLMATGYGTRTGDYPAPTVLDGLVYTPVDANGTMLGADASTGLFKFWRSTILPATNWTPAVDDRYVYQYAGNALHLSDRLSGAVLHTIPGPAGSIYGRAGAAPVRASATTVFGIDEYAVIAFDTAALKSHWSVSGNFQRTPGYHDGSVFIPNDLTRTLEVRDAADGALLWSWQPDRPADFGSDVLVTNNLVLVSTKLATYAIDRTTHATVWSYPAAGTLALTPNGTLFIKGATSLVAIALH